MKTYIPKIIGKPSDYWICKECNGLNWYENEECTGESSLILDCEGLKPLMDNSMEREQNELEVLKWVDVEIEDRKDIRCSNCQCEEGCCDFDENELDSIEIYV